MMACVPTPEERFTIEVPDKGAVSAALTRPGDAFAWLALFHGAGAGMDHPFMAGFARAMADEGVATLRCNFPYIEAGKRSPAGGRRHGASGVREVRREGGHG
jgi:predicted alpha/beta-hydrolase family hydrolase